jgi:hypothetical protein
LEMSGLRACGGDISNLSAFFKSAAVKLRITAAQRGLFLLKKRKIAKCTAMDVHNIM